jgi:hypothetical protein
VDYAKFSDNDLQALYNNDLTKLSDNGLQELYTQYNPPAPKEVSGAFKTGAKRAGLGALPAAAGFGIGSAAEAAISAAKWAPGWTKLPVGLLAGIAGGLGAGKLQQAAMEAAPETVKRMGLDPETLAAEEESHPWAAKVGELAPNLALARPSYGGLKALAGMAEPEAVSAARATALKMAGANTVGDVLQQKFVNPTGDLDLKRLGESALLGGLSTHTTSLGHGVSNLGRRAVGAEPLTPEGMPYQEQPAATSEVVPEVIEGQEQPPTQQPATQTHAENLFRNTVLDALKESPTIKQFKEVTGLDHKTAKAEMDRLVDEGYLTHDEKSGRYSIVPEYSQYSFTDEGEKPRAAFNEIPAGETPTTPEAYESKRQMDLFGNMPSGEKPPLYVDEKGMASTVLPNAQEVAIARQAAAKQQLAALPEGSQFDIFGGTSRAPEPQVAAEEAPVVSDQQKDLFGQTLDVDPQGRVYTGTTPENLSPTLLNDTQMEFFRQEALKKEQAAKDFIAAKEKAKQEAQAAREAKKKARETPPTAEPSKIVAPKATAGEPIFDDETFAKALDAVITVKKASVPVIQKATGMSRSSAQAFMKLLRDKGITDAKNRVTHAKETPPSDDIRSNVGAGGNREGDELSVQPAGTGVSDVAANIPGGLGSVSEAPKQPNVAEVGVQPTLDYRAILQEAAGKSSEQLREEAATGVLNLVGPKDRLRLVRNLFKNKPVAETPKAETVVKPLATPTDPREMYRSAAIDAYENDKIDDATYNKITDELKKPNPNFKEVDDTITGKKKERIAERQTKRIEEKFSQKGQKKTQKELEEEADRLLREDGVDLNFDPDDIRFQRGAGEKGAVPHENVVKAANEATRGWKNAPKVNVVRSIKDLPKHLQNIPDDTRGFYDPATKTVHVIGENAPSAEGVKATVFHEALGHYGLKEKFRNDLDSVLSKMYDNPNMRREAEKWLKDNPDTYAHLDDATQKARAVEEVLAERSEGGQFKEGWLKGTYNRVIAAVRNWMRGVKQFFGSDLSYSDNDIAQILRQAHEEVVNAPPVRLTESSFDPAVRYKMSPEAQVANDIRLMRSYGSVNDNKPTATKELMERGRETLSTTGSAIRRGILSGMTVHQIANEYEHAMPSLRTRHDVINTKSTALRTSMEVIGKNVTHMNKVFKRYSYAQRQKMFDIFNRTTRDQIEVLDDSKRDWAANKTDPLYREFHALPKDVQDVYRTMRETYHKQSTDTLDFLSTIMSPSQYQRMVQQWKSKRLPVYLPLFRSGEHWVSYTDNSGEFVKRSFETPRERELAIEEAKKAGAKDIERYHNIQQMIKKAPPTGFFGDVVGALRKAKVDDSVIASVVDSYLKLLPAKSVLQMTRKREGTAGYEPDVLRSYANVATSQALHLNNMRYNHELDTVMRSVREEALKAASLHGIDPKDPKSIPADVAHDLLKNAEESHQLELSPTYNPKISGIQYASYAYYLGGNVSTAVLALTDIPLNIYPVLSKVSGFGNAGTAMLKAMSHSLNYHFNKGKGLPADVARVLKQGNEDGVLGERRAEDISEFKAYGTDRYLGIKAKADKVMNKTLGAADKANRDVTLLASYELNKNKLAKEGMTGDTLHNEAYKRAKQDVYDAIGSGMSGAGANLARHPLGKLAMTFKHFALNREYLIYRSFKDAAKGESPEVKKAALRQLVGFYAMAGVFAGVQGMPLVGWGELLAQLCNDVTGGDDSFDATEYVKQSVGMLPYKGFINYALNVNASDRAGWDNMLWRDDEKRRSDIGFIPFATERLLGPTYTLATQNFPNAWDHFKNGRLERGLEAMLPLMASNVLKGIRYGVEGATTKDGIPIKKDINAYNAFMQILGFAPADLAEIQKENSNRIGAEKKIYDSRKTLLTQATLAHMSGDREGFTEILHDIGKFSARHPGVAITGTELGNEIKKHYTRLALSTNGVYVNPKLRAEIEALYPQEEE